MTEKTGESTGFLVGEEKKLKVGIGELIKVNNDASKKDQNTPHDKKKDKA